ncbi:MAG: LysR family transcriptional regulator [Rhodospirillales bacterium]|nr:LysR family transcriptional regulator [Rhodospirillales bacterium]
MNWKAINFDWNKAKAFLVAAEEKSFSAAAKSLKVTQSTLGRQVAALEEELGVVLFERVGKGIEITPSGLDLLEFVKEMASSANKLSLAANGKSMEITGCVAITSSEVVSAFVLPRFIEKLRQIQPRITIEIISSNDTKDLRRREADIAIRNQPTEHPDLISRKIKETYAYLYATKEFIEKHGSSIETNTLNGIVFMGMPDNSKWIQALRSIGLMVDESNFPIVTESHLVHWSIMQQGMAIGAMPQIAVLGDKNIQRVFSDLPGIPIETWVVSHRELKTNKRIRYVYDQLIEYLNQLHKHQ